MGQIGEYRQGQRLRYQAMDGSIGLRKKKVHLQDLDELQRAKWEEINTYKNYQRQMDEDIFYLDRELRERERDDDALFDEQKGLQRAREELNAEKYMDSIEGELRKIEEERSQLRDFMQYIVNIDHHYGTNAIRLT